MQFPSRVIRLESLEHKGNLTEYFAKMTLTVK